MNSMMKMAFKTASCFLFGVLSLYIYSSALSYGSSDFAIIGDAGKWTPGSKMVLESILAEKVHQLILPGDNIYNLQQSYQEVWKPWSDVNLDFTLVAIGNHTAGYDKEISFFKMPAEFYAKGVSGALFLILNSDNQATGELQAKWLAKTLKGAKQQLVFVVFHHPPFSATKTHQWKERKGVLGPVREVLSQYRSRISALILGHDHVSSFISAEGYPPMIISGAVQEQRHEVLSDYMEDKTQVRNLWTYRGDPSWVKLKILDGAQRAELEFINASNHKIECTVELSSGKYSMKRDCQDSSKLPGSRITRGRAN